MGEVPALRYSYRILHFALQQFNLKSNMRTDIVSIGGVRESTQVLRSDKVQHAAAVTGPLPQAAVN